MTSVPEFTRMIARIEGWKEESEKARGRAETDRALGEAHKLFDEISNMLTEIRRELLGSGYGGDRHGCGLSFDVTTKSVLPVPHWLHRNRRWTSGTSPRPVSTRAGRSASA